MYAYTDTSKIVIYLVSAQMDNGSHVANSNNNAIKNTIDLAMSATNEDMGR
jgi:hypothetical protein